ncbi:MAG: FkbM family methyltransferase [Chitinophagaceae bacterium]|nr:FkbM family methyltransferase [Chitinophagaceae bacterium]
MTTFSGLSEIKNLTRSDFERACSSQVDHEYVGNNTILCRVLGRQKMYVDATDSGIAPHLIMDGYWESWLTLLFANIIKPGDVCLDIGANFGYFSILMSELSGSSGKTISVEANPRIAEFLKLTRLVNGNKFDLVQSAISDKKGEAIMTITDHELGGGTIKPNELIAGRTQVPVSTISIDELLEEKNIQRVDVMKIDVEGVEPLVFKGMTQTLKKNPDLQLIIEYSPSIYDNAQEFTEFLFSRFKVYQATNVDVITELKHSGIAQLCAIPSHTDLYLTKK